MRLSSPSLLCRCLVYSSMLCVAQASYLLFDYDPGEGFNFCKNAIHRVFSLVRGLQEASATKKREWTLVLPTFHNRNGQGEYQFSDFFDLKRLNEAYDSVHAVEAADYISLSSGKVDVNLFFRYKPGVKELHAGCPSSDEVYHEGYQYYKEAATHKTVTYAGSTLTMGKHKCLNFQFDNAMTANDPKLAQLLLEEIDSIVEPSADKKSIMLGNFDRVLPDWHLPDEVQIHERRHLAYAKQLVNAADAFMEAAGLTPKAYVALHWRRKDFRRHHPNTFSTPVQVGASMAGICQKTGFYSVFLATDTSVHEVEALREAMQAEIKRSCQKKDELRRRRRLTSKNCPKVSLLTYERSMMGNLNPMQAALVEQLVASRALHFVGSMYSTFSHEIHYERRARGFRWEADDSTMVEQAGLLAGVKWSD